ncbi:MAG: aspartate/glutamate racemase family protein, partial [Lachnospiraceae bacterium]|nr:aspartate/glutamate racemase family protein [Lachnospiraceae bacterium]
MTNLQENEKPIAVFDSGLGGLTVFREILRQLPDENLIYFGDTARVPYGSKSRETIIHYTEQILNFLRTKEVKAIVVACNTVSAYALEELKDRVEVPIIGVVKPGAY